MLVLVLATMEEGGAHHLLVSSHRVLRVDAVWSDPDPAMGSMWIFKMRMKDKVGSGLTFPRLT